MVSENNLDGFLIHVDADVLDDKVMPAVDSREKDGLSYVELSKILVPLLSSPKSIGIEITILNPDLDKSGQYSIKFVENFSKIISTRKSTHYEPNTLSEKDSRFFAHTLLIIFYATAPR